MNLKFPNHPSLKTSGLRGIGFALLTFWRVGGESEAQSADDLLRAVRAAESKIQYSATQVVERGGSREVARLFRSGPKRRIEWLEPSVKRGDLLVDDGQKVWLYHRDEKTAIRTNSSSRNPGGLGSDWKLGPAVRQNGRTVRVLTRDKGRQLTIDAATKAILRSQSPVSTTTLQNVRFGAIPAAKFQFSPPAGVKTTELNGTLYAGLNAAKRQADWFYAPTVVPAGYTLESVIVGPAEVWLRYTNGKQRFSIFQQKAEGADVKPTKVDGGWFWKSKGLRFLATGAPAGAIDALAASMK